MLFERRSNKGYDERLKFRALMTMFRRTRTGIDSAINCTQEDDLVLVSTTKVLVPKRTIIIEKNPFGCLRSEFGSYTTDVPEAETPVLLTCPSNTEDIFEIE